MYAWRNNEARSCNHSITYFCVRGVGGVRALACVWARVALIIQHATRHYVVIGRLSGSTIFTVRFLKKKKKGHNIKCVLIFSATFL